MDTDEEENLLNSSQKLSEVWTEQLKRQLTFKPLSPQRLSQRLLVWATWSIPPLLLTGMVFGFIWEILTPSNTEGVFGGIPFEDHPKSDESSGPPPLFTIDIPIDHFDSSDPRTYKNRYWVNDTYYEHGGPVFLFDTGEHGVTNFMVTSFLAEEMGPSSLMSLTRQYKGLAVLWEHRFYGESLPFVADEKTGVAIRGYEAYKYLTIEQALEDVVYLARHFGPPNLKYSWYDLSPDRAPWVFMGGSYPGVRAALIRERNPEIFFASWASSAPVQAQVDMSIYFNTIQKAMPHNCTADMNAAIDYVDGILHNGSREDQDEVRRLVYMTHLVNPLMNITSFDATRQSPQSVSDFTPWDVSQTLAYAFQLTTHGYQNHGFDSALLPFCNAIETYNPSEPFMRPPSATFSTISTFEIWLNNSRDFPATPEGIAKTHGSRVAFHALLSATYQKMLDDNALYNIRGDAVFSPTNRVSWMWQICTELGYFQTSNSSNLFSLISSFDSVESEEINICKKLFPYAPDRPNVAAVNAKYGGWKMNTSNVMFTDGELDPWRALSVQADSQLNPDAYTRNSSKRIPNCNQNPVEGTVFGQVYPGQVHCQDFLQITHIPVRDQSTPYQAGVGLFIQALDEWLPCFKAQS